MIVGYVLKMYPRFSETFILNEVLELERQGVEVRIFSLLKPNDGRFHASLAKVQAKVSYLPERPMDELSLVLPACRNLIRRDPARFWKTLWYALTHPKDAGKKQFLRACVLADSLRSEAVDHLHAHFASSATTVTLLVHMLTGIPYSFTAHAKDIYLKSVNLNFLREKMRAAEFVVTVSDFNQDYLKKLSEDLRQPGWNQGWLQQPGQLQADSARIRRLYNGIDLVQFDPGPIRSAETNRAPLILSVGRLVEKKGFEDLIRACGLLRDQGVSFTCEIIGKGPRESALKGLIAELNLYDSVRLVGPKPQDQIVSIYGRAAVFALPCIVGEDGNRDGLPTVLLEAMAMDLPVVSTKLTGVPEIVDDGLTGALVPPEDPRALSNAIAALLDDPALCKAMGHKARLKVSREFDLRKNVTTLHQWFEKSASREPATANMPVRPALVKN